MPRLLAALREESVEDGQRPLYARALRLKHVEPGKLLCALFFEGSIVVAMLLAFADLVSWWGVLATPVTAAAMVKFNDVVVGKLPDPHAARRPRARAEVPTFDDAVVAGFGGPVEAPSLPEPGGGLASGPGGAGGAPAPGVAGPGSGVSEPDTEVLGVITPDEATVPLPPVGDPDTDATVPLPPLPDPDSR